MAKSEWGTKRVCQECASKFYDMRRDEIVCPNCKAVFQITPPKPKRVQAEVKKPAVEAKPAGTKEETVPGSDNSGDSEGIDGVDNEVDEDQDMIEDTSDLGEDDDDLAEVIQKPPVPDES